MKVKCNKVYFFGQYVEEQQKIEGLSSKQNGDKYANVVEWIGLAESPEMTFKLERVRRYVFFGALVTCQPGRPGVDVMNTIFGDFPKFSEKKLAFFSKTNVMI
jgi:hypothetical protein